MSDHPEDRHGTHPVVAAAKELRGEEDVRVLSTGVKVRLHPVSPSLIAEISASVKYPPVPRIVDGDREIENPMHPDYLREIEECDARKTSRVLEAITMFAFELVDGVPEGDEWLKPLLLLARRGSIDLDGINIKDPLDREFVYKKYVAVGNEDIILAGGMAGIRGEDVQAASDAFRSK